MLQHQGPERMSTRKKLKNTDTLRSNLRTFQGHYNCHQTDSHKKSPSWQKIYTYVLTNVEYLGLCVIKFALSNVQNMDYISVCSNDRNFIVMT